MNEELLLAHLLWMCSNMPDKKEKEMKWNRWLGYMQGQCVALGIMTLDYCKQSNKSSLDYGYRMTHRAITQAGYGLIPERCKAPE